MENIVATDSERTPFTFTQSGYITCPHCGYEQYHTVWWVTKCWSCKREINVVELYKFNWPLMMSNHNIVSKKIENGKVYLLFASNSVLDSFIRNTLLPKLGDLMDKIRCYRSIQTPFFVIEVNDFERHIQPLM